MAEFHPHVPRFDEGFNTNSFIKDHIIYKLIDRHILDSDKRNWKIVAFDNLNDLKEYYNKNLKDKNIENKVKCFETKKQLVNAVLSEFIGIKYKDLTKENIVFYHYILFPEIATT